MAEAYTISMSQGDHAEEHSRRSYTPMSADRSLRDQNEVIYDCGDDKEHFNDFFRPAIEAFNKKQIAARHPERQKSYDYYDGLLNGTEGYGKGKQQEKPVYHDVIQIGNRDTNGVTRRTFDVDHWRQLKKDGKIDEASAYMKQHLNDAQDAKDFKKILKELAQEILENKDGKYDGILIHGLTIHADEPNGTIHLDMRWTMYTDEGTTVRKDGKSAGMSTRVSMNKCLKKLGFKSDKQHTALYYFRESIKDRIEEKMNEMGYQRDIKGEHRLHQSQEVYEMEQRAKEAEAKKEQAEEEAQKVIDEAEAKMKDAEKRESDVSVRESKVAEDEEDIKRRKKKQDDRDGEQDARDAELKAEADRQAEVAKRQKRNDEVLQKNYNTIQTLSKKNDEREKKFQEKEDALDAQKKAQDEREASLNEREAALTEEREGLLADRKAAQEACAVFMKAGEIRTEVQQEAVPDTMMEFLRKQTYRVVATTTDMVPSKDMTGWETVKKPKKDKNGKVVWENRNPLTDYQTYLQGQQRRRTLTEQEQRIIDEAKDLSEQYGE